MTTTEFETLAKSSTASFGLPDISFVVVPHPLAGLLPDAVQAKAEKAFPDILKAATEWKSTGKLPAPKPAYPAETIKIKGTVQDVNDYFVKNNLSLGVPIIPPTKDLVQAMLKGTSRKPDEVLWVVPPRMGTLTVELAATSAVMAGCKPAHLPVLLAAIEAFKEPAYDWQGSTTTTHPNAPLVIVNGPIVKELGIAYSTGAAGPEHLANVCLGHAINLIGDVVGGSIPPDTDKSTLGWVGNTIATVIGENEDENPWGPYHVEKGLKKTDSVVTVFPGAPPTTMIITGWTKGADMLEAIVHSISQAGQNSRSFSKSPVFLILHPAAATVMARDGMNKESIKKYLWENAKVPYHALSPRDQPRIKDALGQLPTDPNTLIPLTEKPDGFQIVISGGPGEHAQYFAAFGGQSVSKVIAK